MTSPGVVQVQLEAWVLHRRPQAAVAERAKSFDQQTEDLCEGERGTRAKISHQEYYPTDFWTLQMNVIVFSEGLLLHQNFGCREQ